MMRNSMGAMGAMAATSRPAAVEPEPEYPTARPLGTTCEPIVGRLLTEFVGLPQGTVERCVVDVWARATHLGLAITPVQVERVAREHLVGVVMSEPPSGRRF
jgi:hypothetical protein